MLTPNHKRLVTFLLNKADAKYRPARFREIIPVQEGGVPRWAQFLEIERTISFAEFVPANQATNNFPMPTETFSSDTFGIGKFMSGFQVLDDEVEQYAQLGVSPSERRVTAINIKSEMILDDIAANGYAAYGLRGFYNQVKPASTDFAPTDPDNCALQELADWDEDTTPLEMASDLEKMVWRIVDQTKENYGRDGDNVRIVLPFERFKQFASLRETVADSGVFTKALQVWQELYPNVPVIGWKKGDGLGEATKGRAVAYVADDAVISMINPMPLTTGKQIETHQGMEQGMKMSTAGVISTIPEGVVYGDFGYTYSP